jgi:AmmeMemoRadiSam system protein B
MFYPGCPEALGELVSSLFQEGPVRGLPGTGTDTVAAPGARQRAAAGSQDQERVVGLIAPHAGYPYSGRTAAAAFAQLSADANGTVIVMGPSHREPFGGATIYPGRSYRTPMGEVPIDHELASQLVERSEGLVRYDEAGHRQEHSVEVELPFLQQRLGSFRFIPLVIGERSLSRCKTLGELLAGLVAEADTSPLLVASSDLSHFYSLSEAERLDRQVWEHVGAFDTAGLTRALETGAAQACGACPIIATMYASRWIGAERAAILDYSTSADATGDRSRVVGYLAAAFLASSE